MTIVTVIVPVQLQQHYGFSPVAAGAAIAPIPIVSLIVAPASGILSDRYPAGILGAIGMVIGCGGLVGLALLPAAPQAFDVMWRMAVCGCGFGMFFSPNARQVVAASPVARAAAAGALFSTTRGAGPTLGATVVAALLASRFGNSALPMLIGAGLAVAAGFCSVAALRRPA